MAYDYSDDAAFAVTMIRDFGRPMTLVTSAVTGPEYDPTVTETETAITGVVTYYSALERNGDQVQSGDKKILFDASIPIPSSGHIVDGADRYAIVDPGEYAPGDTVLFYRTQARR